MLTFDHIAIATTDLATGTRVIADALGVALQKGGKHTHYGTHNMLLGLGDIYLEVIAKDPDAPPKSYPTWFNLDHFSGPPRPANWICRTTDFTTAPPEVGPPVQLARDDIRWELTVPDDGSLPFDGAYPSLLRWAPGITPPAQALPESGCRLVSWTVIHPDAARIAPMVPLDDSRVAFETGPAGFRAVIATPRWSGHAGMIRPATGADAPAIRAIWNDLIRDTTVTFNSVPKTAEEVAAFLQDTPVFVADIGGVVGYASYGAFRGGIGYRRIAEHSIVLTGTARRQGLGRALMDQVAAHAKANDINSLIAGVSGENADGQAFHTRLGFAEVGRIPQAGFKFDRWITLVLMQKRL